MGVLKLCGLGGARRFWNTYAGVRAKKCAVGKTKYLIGAQGLCDGINMVEPRARPCAAIEYNVKLYYLSNPCCAAKKDS
jgi:hypothetical protein